MELLKIPRGFVKSFLLLWRKFFCYDVISTRHQLQKSYSQTDCSLFEPNFGFGLDYRTQIVFSNTVKPNQWLQIQIRYFSSSKTLLQYFQILHFNLPSTLSWFLFLYNFSFLTLKIFLTPKNY